MNRFDNSGFIKKIFRKINFNFLFLAAIVAAFVMLLGYISGSEKFDEKKILEDSIKDDIVHCYALEGVYPPDIEYIEDNYGLNYDHNRFIVDYNIFADNVMPNFYVIERNDG